MPRNLTTGVLTESVAPSGLVVSLAEFKAHVRVDHSLDDTLLTAYLTAAQNSIQEWQNRQLLSATYVYKIDAFPSDEYGVELPRPPATSVSSIGYVDADGDSQTLATSVYTLIDGGLSNASRVRLDYNQSWPDTRSIEQAVTITYVTGYADAASVPETTKHAIKIFAATLYENREDVVVGQIISKMPDNSPGLRALVEIDSFRTQAWSNRVS